MLYNEKSPTKQRRASKIHQDHHSVNSAESDDDRHRTPVHYLNPLEEYLNSSPLDHGPPELSTLSERYGDPSSPSQRTPGAKARQKSIAPSPLQPYETPRFTRTRELNSDQSRALHDSSNTTGAISNNQTDARPAASDSNLFTPVSKLPPSKPTPSSHNSVSRRLRLSGPAERLKKKDDMSPDRKGSSATPPVDMKWNRQSLDNLPLPKESLEPEMARSDNLRLSNSLKQVAHKRQSVVNYSPNSSSLSDLALSSPSPETSPDVETSPRKRLRTTADNGSSIINKVSDASASERSKLKEIVNSGKLEIPKWEDLRKSSAKHSHTSPYATTPSTTNLNTRYERHNNADSRSERHRKNSNENLFNSSRSSLPGSTNLSSIVDAQTWQLGDRRTLDGTRFLSTTEMQTKEPAITRSYLSEHERRALVRQQEQERLDRAEREKERLEKIEREKIERELQRKGRERRDQEYSQQHEYDQRSSNSVQTSNLGHPQDKQLGMPPPKTPSTPNWKTTLVNKHWYTVLDQLGKGGTGRVWRVMSHTHHRIFALKHVSLAEVDSEATISSYINEIRLLERLSGHSRIVKLYDYEVNQQNGYIQMILECGELDMNTLLAKQQGKPINLNFIRMYWEQMLEAVHAIHQQKIVHSDLKPANFILVQGALKLIDFGIAKAIPNDTTNIQRDIQVGTLNYMSPEAIKDSHGGQANGREMMKLGRPSDVWSLGCILYQMVYGRTPFHHVKGMWQKLACISNPTHEIEFPKVAVPVAPPVKQPDGTILPAAPLSPTKYGVKVEADLLNVMKHCLQRDPKQRKTIPQLLQDPFVKPDQVLKQLYERAYQQGIAGQPLDADSVDNAIEVRHFKKA
ncbi:hypothetical protein INT43_003766 [Umbelopsis isabellina]|uniref:Protein kinase domain-containing protein n=1 Tax=Mortierella isabellina TaxID=91625 RepID=A0A8H7UI63_MORIS|nr:hypothetical protein INT43_003766 [Umbelopsis isabellina]